MLILVELLTINVVTPMNENRIMKIIFSNYTIKCTCDETEL